MFMEKLPYYINITSNGGVKNRPSKQVQWRYEDTEA